MFRHKGVANNSSGNDDADERKEASDKAKGEESGVKAEEIPPNDNAGILKELLEKNLKWSQIIYEQNRRINRKLLWSAIAGWVRLLVIVIPLILAVLYLSPIVKGLMEQYRELFDMGQNRGGEQKEKTLNFDSIIKMLPLDAAQKQRLRSILK